MFTKVWSMYNGIKVEQLLYRARSLEVKFKQGGDACHIDEAIVLDREALTAYALGHPRRPACLTQLSFHLWVRYQRLAGMETLNEAIELRREALALCPSEHPLQSSTLISISALLFVRYNQLGKVDDLHEGIVFGRASLVHRPPGHPDRLTSLNILANHYDARYQKLGEVEDLNIVVVFCQERLSLHPPGHSDRAMRLDDLANRLFSRYKLLGRMEDLNEATVLEQETLELRPPGHPSRPISLNNLATYLCIRYRRLGGVEDLDEAIILDREALVLHPPGNQNRATSLHNLAGILWTRYRLHGKMEDLNEAIVLSKDALSHRPPGNEYRSLSLNSLAICLHNRYRNLGAIEDLNEAIVLDQEALELRPPGHPSRPISLSSVAHGLKMRYKELGIIEALDESIVLNREALMLRPPGHPDRAMSLENLADVFWTRFNQIGRLEDLDDSIVLEQESLSLHPPGHPRRSFPLKNLADRLHARYQKLGRVDDLNEAIVLDGAALSLCPPGHPERSSSLMNFAEHLTTRYKKLSDPKDAEKIFHLYAQLSWELETVSSDDLIAAKAWAQAAEDFNHPTTLLAYQTTLRLLVRHVAALPLLPQHLGVLKTLSSSLAVDAFSACLRNRSPTSAVELLEQGRGVFWSQLTRLHSALDDVVASGPAGKTLADEFKRVTSLIRNVLDSSGSNQHDQLCHLNLELENVVSDIRELPGLSRFLLPSLFSDLRHAASGGPVIIVNASRYSCDALVVFIDKDPVHIPLSITNEDVRELSLKLHTLTIRAKRSDVTRDLGMFLRELWDRVVSPIAGFLHTAYPPRTRIWWCPTAEFSLLPLHAAGPHRKGEHNFGDLYISSYTPTLSALIRARKLDSTFKLSSMSELKRFVAIGQANASGTKELLSVSSELANIGQLVDGLAMFKCIQGEESYISSVTEELKKNKWVHLACHGIPNRKQPFESAFALHDGHLTIQRIIQCDLQNPEFAYLSACHTTVGDEESPDEVIHLAAAMQFAGFRSVIGTMWAVDDAETNKITSVFYKHMVDFESGCLDHTRAAFALWKTMRSVKIPLDQRILYIHLGA